MFFERDTEKLTSGRTLHTLHNGEGRVFGHFVIEPDGQARIWQQTWWDSYSPTDEVFPDSDSAERAILEGWA